MSSPELTAAKAHTALDRIDDALDRILAATEQIDTDPHDDQEPPCDDDA